METTTSADGSVIAYESSGNGRLLVCVSPAFGLRDVYAGLADELADDYTVVRYDRRGRGDSTDAIAAVDVGSFEIAREVEDLAAVLKAVGSEAALLGYSSGAQLALNAATAGLPIAQLALYEPPFRPGDDTVRTELVDKLITQVAAGRPGDAVATFQIEGVGMPPEMVEGARNSPMWPAMEAIAQTVVYDAMLTSEPAPNEAMRTLDLPMIAIAGAETWPFLQGSTRFAADAIAAASFLEVPGGANHHLDPVETAAALRTFLG
jgi:pimeloyl-ACP methyl ester carboxylesterase